MNRQGRIGQVVELNETGFGLNGILYCNCQQFAEYSGTLKCLAAV